MSSATGSLLTRSHAPASLHREPTRAIFFSNSLPGTAGSSGIGTASISFLSSRRFDGNHPRRSTRRRLLQPSTMAVATFPASIWQFGASSCLQTAAVVLSSLRRCFPTHLRRAIPLRRRFHLPAAATSLCLSLWRSRHSSPAVVALRRLGGPYRSSSHLPRTPAVDQRQSAASSVLGRGGHGAVD